ncbi:MAG: EAL domain-containing protein, partial [Thiobacillaceae bacterium]|nr:EAL domain-containing protein [Thiobacillaceae bacterium]
VLTGSGDQAAVAAALKAGADDYVVKRGDYLQRLPHLLQRAHARFGERAERRRRGLRVLYVEHNAADVDLLQRHLAQHAPHIELEWVPDAPTALARLVDGSLPACDVLLVDYRLPGMDGLELARQLREDYALQTPIVLVTAHGSEDVAASALHLGVDDYLAKHTGYLAEVPAVLEKVVHEAELARLSRRLAQVVAASPAVLYSLRQEQQGLVLEWVSENATQVLGTTVEADFPPVHPQDRCVLEDARRRASEDGHAVVQYRLQSDAWPQRWVRDELNRVESAHPAYVRLIGVLSDVSTRVLSEQVEAARRAALDALLAGRPLDAILTEIACRLEAIAPQMRIAILLVEPRRGVLRLAAAPSLPQDYNRSVDGFPIAEGNGSCGSAAALGEPVIVSDVFSHPNWAPYREAIRNYGFRACASWPFKDGEGRVLGTFAAYLAEARPPTAQEVALIEPFCQIAALAVMRVRAEERLRQAVAVFESTRDGILITDAQADILAVNPAFCRISGYSAEELVGRPVAMLKSLHHDPDFYRAIRSALLEVGHWQGEIWNRRKDGELYPLWLNINGLYDEEGRLRGYVGVATDLSELRSAQERLQHLAHHDPLTDLPNRLLFNARLQAAIERAHRHGLRLAVLFIDLDRFKDINDSLGHPVGDDLLVSVAHRLHSRLREGDTLARLGGDEFVLLLQDIATAEQAAAVARDLIDRFAQPFELAGGQQAYVGLSIGISLYPDDATDATALVQHADTAMYEAKAQGRNTYRFHIGSMTERARARLTLETRLRQAVQAEEFLLHYQPLIDLRLQRPYGIEALLRWLPRDGTLTSPAQFIGVAEETGLILPIGAWVLRTACRDAQRLRAEGLSLERLAVNLSMRQFQASELVDVVAAALAESGLPPSCLELELTESLLMHDPQKVLAALTDLKRLGVRLAIDDFGTGYSSLAYLRRFPIDTLKIDRAFIQGLGQDAADRAIAATIVAIARTLGLGVLAEGVETAEQLAQVRALECDAAQGFLLAHPMPLAELVRWWRTGQVGS